MTIIAMFYFCFTYNHKPFKISYHEVKVFSCYCSYCCLKTALVSYDFRPPEVILIGGTHSPPFDRLGRPEVVFHPHLLIVVLFGEQKHSEHPQLHSEGQKHELWKRHSFPTQPFLHIRCYNKTNMQSIT